MNESGQRLRAIYRKRVVRASWNCMKYLSGPEVDKLRETGKVEEYLAKVRELTELRESFVMTNSWHFMKNECYMIGIW